MQRVTCVRLAVGLFVSMFANIFCCAQGQNGENDSSTSLVSSNDSHAGAEKFSFAGTKNLLFVLDSSFWMREKLDVASDQKQRETKMDVAKSLIQIMVSIVPSTVNAGLRVYGNKEATNSPFADCKASALLVPLGLRNRRAILEEVGKIQPKGDSPLEFSLHEVFKHDLLSAQGRSVVILLSDGRDSCNGHPYEFMGSISQSSASTPVVVASIGVAGQPQCDIQELRRLAQISHGKYYDSHSFQSLLKDIKSVGSTR
jgi:Ca-activated chloride channel homolog